MVMNLISNAVKFTPSGQKVGLIVSGFLEEKKLRVTVWDHGIGIKEEDIGKLFKSFVQLDTSLARVYQGTGLGLAIVSSVMKLHQGNVSVESNFGQGSQFHLDFPWDPTIGSESQHLTPAPIELNSVLVVEDSKIDADKVKRYLDEMGAEVFWDPTGNDAVMQAKKVKPDLILLDLYLPEFLGWEILKELKADPDTASIPVVVCSVLELDEQRQESILLQDYLVKPLSRRSLRRALRSYDIKKEQLEKALVVQPSEHKTELTILIVDDNQSNIQLVHDYLKRKGYRILTAEDGYQAVQVTRALQPDLILMDVQMPHMDGIEATSHIRKDPSINHIPIFALTALAMPGDRERCLDAGMDQYFTKPVSLRQLYKQIKSTLT
jgi:CheY-like chemotaxis protein